MCADIRTVQISFKKIQPLLRQFPIRLPDAVYNDVILAFGQKHYVLYWCLKEATEFCEFFLKSEGNFKLYCVEKYWLHS